VCRSTIRDNKKNAKTSMPGRLFSAVPAFFLRDGSYSVATVVGFCREQGRPGWSLFRILTAPITTQITKCSGEPCVAVLTVRALKLNEPRSFSGCLAICTILGAA